MDSALVAVWGTTRAGNFQASTKGGYRKRSVKEVEASNPPSRKGTLKGKVFDGIWKGKEQTPSDALPILLSTRKQTSYSKLDACEMASRRAAEVTRARTPLYNPDGPRKGKECGGTEAGTSMRRLGLRR